MPGTGARQIRRPQAASSAVLGALSSQLSSCGCVMSAGGVISCVSSVCWPALPPASSCDVIAHMGSEALP
eukprot:scaffold173189_cov33-Tisochrysis_lutea.AAC.1